MSTIKDTEEMPEEIGGAGTGSPPPLSLSLSLSLYADILNKEGVEQYNEHVPTVWQTRRCSSFQTSSISVRTAGKASGRYGGEDCKDAVELVEV